MTLRKEYLTKRDLLKAVHKAKNSYCSYLDPQYADYHQIVASKDLITPAVIENIVQAKAKPKGKAVPVILASDDIVFRVMTHEHIPLDPDRKRVPKSLDQPYSKTNFPPFKHYILKQNELKEVGRSHWVGGFDNGHFSFDHGRMTDELGKMFILIVDRIARKPNFCGYSYRDEMQANAILGLCQNGLKFDESKSDNPFAFYTTSVIHSFIRVLNVEKRTQVIRDDLLEVLNKAPSLSRQLEQELAEKFPPSAVPTIRRKTRAPVD